MNLVLKSRAPRGLSKDEWEGASPLAGFAVPDPSKRRATPVWLLVIILATVALGAPASARSPRDYVALMAAVAADIAALKEEFPQLVEFSPASNLDRRDRERPVIDYAYHAYYPQPQEGRRFGGWSSHVPNPDADGVWFYIAFYDRKSALQIDAQPAVWHPLCLGRKRITFLILDGKTTASPRGSINAILRRHGAKGCG